MSQIFEPVSFVALLPLLWCAATVAAQSSARDAVQLSIPDCEHAPSAAIRKLVALDLAARGLHVAAPAEPATVRARLQCSQEHASIAVADDLRATPLELSLSLRDTPAEARARFLALALAELIATNELERPAQRDAKGAEERPEATSGPAGLPGQGRGGELESAAGEADPAPLLRGALWLAAGGMLGYAPTVLAPELQLGAAVSFKRFLVELDADFAWATRHVDAAAVRVRLLSFALAPGLRLLDGTLAWDIAAGVRTSRAWLSADATQADEAGRALSGLLLAPLVRTTLALRFAARWRVQLALELDYIAKPLRGLASDGSSLIALRGVRAALLLGLRFAWNE